MVQPEGPLKNVILFFCHPTMAILLGSGAALLLLGRPFRKDWSNWIQSSLSQAGPIIFITIAGGALGAVLKATPLSEVFRAWTERSDFSLLWLYVMAFLMAAGLKTAQGSSTASLVISSSIIAPLLSGLPPLDSVEKALLVLTIGAGAMTVSHANDSYFWVINQYAGIDTPRMYRYFTRATLVMGIATLISCLLLVSLL
jgi:GntP family gluconate:H+ symporter